MMLRVATRPLQRRMMSSQAVAKVDAGVYAAELGQGYAPTMTYSNRPAWIAGSRTHWLVTGIHKLGPIAGPTAVYLAVAGCAGAIIQMNEAAFSGNDPRTLDPKWARATRERKMGKRPIYWETKADPVDDDDDDDDE